MVEYDVLGNERHKAVCGLMKLPDGYPSYSAFPFARWYKDLSHALGISDDEFSCAMVRDTLIHLLGGDTPNLSDLLREDDDGVDARPSDSASADSPVHGAAGCACGGACGCDGEEHLAPITTELRSNMRIYGKFSIDDGKQHVELDADTFAHLCDAIDAVHASLERDYKAACDVNEHQDLEYVALAKRYDKTISLPLDADGVPIRIGDVMDFTKNVRGLTVLGIGIVDASESSLGEFGLGVFVREGSDYVWYNAEFLHHHVPTVEDVLREFTDAWAEWKDGAAMMNPVETFAAKLKLADA